MRLLDCHIENFGKLTNTDYVFSPGLNIINEENGWGKSTFAAFIRVMFYGFEGEKKQKLSNERRKYAPWQGGAYGGSLRFETGDKIYRIERTFGFKEAEDVSKLYYDDMGLIADAYDPSRLGEELFGVDSASFLRTVFISQDDCRYDKTTEGINRKLGNTALQSDTDAGYDTVVTRLRKRVSEINSRVREDSLPNMKRRIAELENEVRKGSALDHSQEEVRDYIAKAREKINDLQNQRKDLAGKRCRCLEAEEAEMKAAHLSQLEAEADERHETLEKCRMEFSGTVPDRTQVEYASSMNRLLDSREAAIRAYQLSEDEMYELECLKEKYGDDPDKVKAEDHILFNGSGKGGVTALYITSLILILAGLSVLFFLKMNWGSIVAGLGLVTVGAAALYGKNLKNKRAVHEENERRRVTSDIERYRIILDKRAEYQSLNDEADEIYLKLQHFTDALGVEFPKDMHSFLTGLMEKITRLELADSEYRRSLERVRRFKEENGNLTELKHGENDGMTVDTLEERINEIDDELSVVENSIRDYQRRLETLSLDRDDISEKEEELEALKAGRDSLEEKVRLFRLTEEMLTRARDSMTKKYSGPIFENFRKYYEFLNGRTCDDFSLDARNTLTYRAFGISRDTQTLSDGYRDLTGLCMRLALADAVYKDEKPFIILDDPFVNLDDEKLREGVELLNRTGKEKQVIYFTCNSSRAM